MTNVRVKMVNEKLFDTLSLLSEDCKKILGEKEQYFTDHLDEIRKIVEVFHDITHANVAMDKQLNSDPFQITYEKEEKASQEINLAIDVLEKAKKERADFYKQTIIQQEQVLDEKASVEIRRLSDELKNQLDLVKKEQLELSDDIDHILKGRMFLRAYDKDIAPISEVIKKKTIQLIALKEKSEVVKNEYDIKIQSVKTSLQKEKQLLNVKSDPQNLKVKRAEDEVFELKKALKEKIALQEKLCQSAVSASVMYKCLQAYDCFTLMDSRVIDQIMDLEKKNKNSEKLGATTQIFWASESPSQKLERIRDRINKVKNEVKSFLNELWCPESGYKSGAKLHELYKAFKIEDKEILYKETPSIEDIKKIVPLPEGKEKPFSISDLKTKLVPHLPASLSCNHSKPVSLAANSMLSRKTLPPSSAMNGAVVSVTPKF